MDYLHEVVHNFVVFMLGASTVLGVMLWVICRSNRSRSGEGNG